jgi:hypothetical protein
MKPGNKAFHTLKCKDASGRLQGSESHPLRLAPCHGLALNTPPPGDRSGIR